jgi:hypothetical protein
MKQWFIDLPGPMVAKVIAAAVVALVALVALFFVYDWIGNALLDTGGTVG